MATRDEIARALHEISRHLELDQDGRFKARAYANAARVIQGLTMPIDEFIGSGRIDATPGIGKATGAVIREIALGGRSSVLDELRKRNPESVLALTRIPGLGSLKVALLRDKLGVETIEDLEAAARRGDVARLRGFGSRGEQKLLASIESLRSIGERFLLPQSLELGRALLARLESFATVDRSSLAGSTRRWLETVGGVDLCVASRSQARLAEEIRREGILSETEEERGMIRGRSLVGIPVRIIVAPPAEFATTLFFATGSKEFVDAVVNVASKKGYALDSSGLRRDGRSAGVSGERALFRELGLRWVVPELRENADMPRARKSPRLVRRDDIRGVFHVHTTYSDGRAPLREMLAAARARRFDYVGISDHSKAAYYARGLDLDRLRQQQAEIDAAAPEVAPMRVFKGTEADILQDGSIDYGDRVLRGFDFVVASVHSRFGMSREEMTERIVRGLSNPFVTFLGHPTGRLLLSRQPYAIDFDRIFDAAAEHGVIVEINGSPRRLDLDWRLMQRAVDRGVLLSIHPDAHSVEEYRYVISACRSARKGGLDRARIFNTRPLDEVGDYLQKRRERAIALSRPR